MTPLLAVEDPISSWVALAMTASLATPQERPHSLEVRMTTQSSAMGHPIPWMVALAMTAYSEMQLLKRSWAAMTTTALWAMVEPTRFVVAMARTRLCLRQLRR
jgi:hypothetical protein